MQEIVVRKANIDDIVNLKMWLENEFLESGTGFYGNWSVIEKAAENRMLEVFVKGDETVAFIADGLGGPDIIEVHPGYRGQGFGRKAAEKALKNAYDRGNALVYIECAPSSSIPFWEKMGFTVVGNAVSISNKNYAYRLLPRKLHMPEGEPINYSIKLYPEERDWNPNIDPIRHMTGVAHQLGDIVHLPERAILYDPRIPAPQDGVLSIEVDGINVFEAKIKRPDAAKFGVQIDLDYNFYLDTIIVPA